MNKFRLQEELANATQRHAVTYIGKNGIILVLHKVASTFDLQDTGIYEGHTLEL